MSDHYDNPYVGPRTFSRAESHLFFGREREARDLLSLVVSERLVLFYAQSGAGKSSLLNARLIPALEAKDFEVLPVGRVSGELLPGEKVDNCFAHNLLLSLNQKEGEAHPLSDPNMALKDFLWNYGSAETTTPETEPVAETDTDYEIWPRALIIDQFEEIFTTNLQEWPKRADFFKQLQEAMADDDYLWVVLTMREDYLASLDPYAHLLPSRLRARFYMQRMSYEAALEAVKKPVSEKRPFAPEVAEKLVNNLRQIQTEEGGGAGEFLLGEFIEPVQLQVVCYQLWENLKKEQTQPEITMADLERLAGGEDLAQFVNKALAEFYEQAVAGCAENKPGQTEFDLRDWFETKLITKARTRALVLREAEQTGGLDNRIVNKLANRFLLRAESRAGSRWYELVHDRFVEPILQANETWRRGHPLIQAAREWKEAGEPDSKLYSGQQLVEALQHPDATIMLVREFLEAGQAAEVERERELAAIHQARLNRILKWGITLLTGMALIALGAAIFAFDRQQEAQRQARLAGMEAATAQAAKATAEAAEKEAKNLAEEAEISAADANAAREIAEALREEADKGRQDAERQSAINTSLKLASEALRSLDGEPYLGLLLAIEAISTTDTVQADDALRQALQRSQVRAIFHSHIERVTTLAFSPDGTRLVTASADGTARLWDVEDIKRSEKPPASRELAVLSQHTDRVVAIAFSPDGTRLVTASADGTALLWDIKGVTRSEREPSRPPPTATLSRHEKSLTTVIFSPDGTRLVTASADGTARVWDAQTGSEVRILAGHQDEVNAVAFSPAGNHIATASADGIVRLWNVANESEAIVLAGHTAGVNTLAFSPDGTLLATAGADNTARLWLIATGEEVAILSSHTDSLTAIAFDPTGKWLATGSIDATVNLWDVALARETGGREVAPLILRGHESRINSVAFDREGRRLVTASADKTARLWNVTTGELEMTLRGHTAGVNAALFNPDGTLVATASSDSSAWLWDITSAASSGEIVLSGHGRKTFEIAFSPDGKLLATSS